MRIAIPDLISPSYFPAIAAVELGFFKKEGLDAELQLIFPVPRAMQAMKDGSVDLVAASGHAPLMAFPDWKGARLLMALSHGMYWFLVLRSSLGAARGDLQAIRGLRIGAAAGVDIGLKELLREAGIDPEKEVQIGPVPGASGTGISFGLTAAKALQEGHIDGFWANGMGAEISVRGGFGTVVLDARRGDGPAQSRHYTFPALSTTEAWMAREPDGAAAAVRAVCNAQVALRQDPSLAAAAVEGTFPPTERALITDLIRRDLPFYDPAITEEMVTHMNRFAQRAGLLSHPVPYDQIVAAPAAKWWHGGLS